MRIIALVYRNPPLNNTWIYLPRFTFFLAANAGLMFARISCYILTAYLNSRKIAILNSISDNGLKRYFNFHFI